MAFVKGNRLGIKGRPKGIIDKRIRLNKSLMTEGDDLLKVTMDAAKAGDMTAMSLLLPRMMPVLKPEGSPIRFALDASQGTSKQIEQLIQALADGQLNTDEAMQIAQMIRLLAEARVADDTGESADKLTQAFKTLAQTLAHNGDSLPPLTLTPEPSNVARGPPEV